MAAIVAKWGKEIYIFHVFEIGAIDVLESKGERWFEEL